MIYTGFNDNELKKILEILDRNNVHYEVLVPDEETLKKPTRAQENLLQIEIDKNEFDKIAEKDIQRLFDLRVYKEEDSPFTEEELVNPTPKIHEKKVDPDAKFKTVTTVLAIVGIVFLALWRKGLFK